MDVSLKSAFTSAGCNDYTQLTDIQRLELFQKLVAPEKLPTLVPLLPLLLSLKGRPYTLQNHFPFESLFSTHVPHKLVIRSGRQVAKSSSIAARGVVTCAARPYFKMLYLTPLHEQILRFSNDYIRPLLEDSPIRRFMSTRNSTGSVLRRAFSNRAVMYFSYAFQSVERVRGLSLDAVAVDEVQDLDPNHLPVIEETMSASEYGLFQYTGTSKTRDGTLEGLWMSSSQAEWCILCQACKHLNVPSMEYDLDKMIGAYRDDISEERPGIICAKCGRSIFPRSGRWVHTYPERVKDFAGYHIPQIILPMHYAKPEKWRALLGKRQGAGNFTTAKFYNEVLGEAYDIATKLVNKSDLEKAGILHQNVEDVAITKMDRYSHKVLAVDWGGGGETGVSLTAIAVLGARPDGIIDVIFGKRLLTPHDHVGEAKEALRLYHRFGCDVLCHDFTGAGNLRETFLIQNGLPYDRSIRITYTGLVTKAAMSYKPATASNPRDYYLVDKTRALQLTCYSIRFGRLLFFAYDYKSQDEPGLLHDFLSLIENKVARPSGSDVYTIQRSPAYPDDFAQAVNIGCCTIWRILDAWPDFGGIELAAADQAESMCLNQVGYEDY